LAAEPLVEAALEPCAEALEPASDIALCEAKDCEKPEAVTPTLARGVARGVEEPGFTEVVLAEVGDLEVLDAPELRIVLGLAAAELDDPVP